MKTSCKTIIQDAKTVVSFTLMGVFVGGGCASLEPIDWNERIGNYRASEAKDELGPPDETEDLPNGYVIATWIDRSSPIRQPAPASSTFYDPQADDQTGITLGSETARTGWPGLSLTFDDQGVMTAWQTDSR